MKIRYFIWPSCILAFQWCISQNDQISINAAIDFPTKEIRIQQEIRYFNRTGKILDTLFFHNWANAYESANTPLSKRLIEDYDKSLFLAKTEDRGHVQIKSVADDYVPIKWDIPKRKQDLLRVVLNEPLNPGDSSILSFTYIVKIPEDSFTRYGRRDITYNLRYWYITPVVYDYGWQLMNNLNMDDLYMLPADYIINFKVPEGITLNTDLEKELSPEPPFTIYHLSGKNRVDIEININAINDFETFKTKPVEIITNLNGTDLSKDLKKDILNRELSFIETHLGPYPFDKLMVNKITYDKNPIYGLNQLPAFLNPFTGTFEWDIKMFKALTREYLENTLIVNRRNDYWLLDGIQTYLIMQYVDTYYPEIKAMGNISKIWGIRGFTMAKLDFNDKYPFVYQFAARRNYDQALTTPADSLSNFNRKIVNKYKAGLGLQYLDSYLNESIVAASIRRFYLENKGKPTRSDQFEELITKKTNKDVCWFFGDYIHSKKKIDYTIKKVKQTGDSVKVTIKNIRNFTVPVALYGVKGKDVVFTKWLPGIDSTTTITLPKGDYDRLSLNYEYIYPELNLRDNWKNLSGLFNKPVQFRFFKDVEDPYFNQVFYNIFTNYNYYDGFIFGPRIYNESLIKKKWIYKITPTYGTSSKKLTGSFSLIYQYIPEETSVYRVTAGIAGSKFHYAPELNYQRLSPFAVVEFKRKSLRDVGGKAISARYVFVNKQVAADAVATDQDNYQIFDIGYAYAKPDLINDFRFGFDYQLADKFSKVSADIRYRKLTEKSRQYDFRFFLGAFINNKTNSDYFSFALDRPSDYLFDYDYLGRSEQSGFFSQQIIIAEGGFKSKFENPYANQWMLTTNQSVSIWRWIELYADAGVYKSKGIDPQFLYDSGIRLNFIHNILEVYFPMQSSLGFEPTQGDYASKIRFVLTVNPNKIINFVRRGFF